MEWIELHDLNLCEEVLVVEPWKHPYRSEERGDLWRHPTDVIFDGWQKYVLLQVRMTAPLKFGIVKLCVGAQLPISTELISVRVTWSDLEYFYSSRMGCWGLFHESPETFRAHFGWHNSLCIFKTKASRGTRLCSYYYFYSLYNIWKDQLYRISLSEFYEWLFWPENFSGLSRNGPLV